MKNLNSNLYCALLSVLLLICGSCSKQRVSEKGENKILIGKVIPKRSAEIESSPFGLQAGTLEDSLVARAAEIGVKWTRLVASWSSIERVKGVYNWESTDKAFEVAIQHGITPFVTIGGGNRLYSKMTTYDDPKLAEIYGQSPEPPTKDPVAMEAFLNFTRATVERYKDKIDYWEIWNEPNHRNYWGSEPNGEEYGRLLIETAKIIRKIDPNAKIIGGSMAGISPEFTDAFLKVGSADYIDIISYHNYGAVPEERVYKAIELWEVIDRYKPALELWQGECGYPSHSSTRDYRGRAPWGLNIQAKWLLRQIFVDIYYCKATLSNYFKLVHPQGKGDKQIRANLRPIDDIFGFPDRGGSRVRTKGVNEKCLLTNSKFEPKPGYYAYQNLCSIWRPGYKPLKTEYNFEVEDEGIFYGISEDDAFPSVPLMAAFTDGDGHHLVAWWLPWNAQENVIEPAKVNITMKDISFKDPVIIDLLTGDVFDAHQYLSVQSGESQFTGIPLTDYPLVIVERNTIQFNKL